MRGLLLVLAGCGRLGFDPSAGLPDGGAEADGAIDLAFGENGYVILSDPTFDVRPFAVVPRGTGYVSVGVFGIPLAGSQMGLHAVSADGAADATFGDNGFVAVGLTGDDFAYGAVRLDDTRILVTGDGQDGADDDWMFATIDDAGALLPAFATDGYLRVDIDGARREDTANRATVVGSHVVSCGVSGYSITDAKFALVRFDLAGTLVTSWGDNGQVVDDFGINSHDVCRDVTPLGSNLIAVGDSDSTSLVIAAYDDVDGTRAAGFGTAGVVEIEGTFMSGRGVAIVEDDIVAVGERDGAGLVVRLAPDGTPRATFGDRGEVRLPQIGTLAAVSAQTNGKLVVAGELDGVPIVARLLPDGALDTAFGTGGIVELSQVPGDVEVSHAMIDAADRIVLVGLRASTTPPSGVIARVR